MADKKILLEVEVNMTDALKELAGYKLRVEEIDKASAALKQRIREEGDESGELRTELVRLAEERKAYNKLIVESSRKIQNQITAEQTFKGTLKGLTAELSKAKDELRAMKLTDPGFEAKTKEVDALNQKVKDLEASYGVFSRNVGNYESGVEGLRNEIRELVKEIQDMERAGVAGSEAHARAVEELTEKQKQLRDETATTSESISGLAKGSEQLEGVTMAATAAAAGLGMLKNVFADGTPEGQKYAAMVEKIQIAIAALTVARQIAEAVRKSSILSMKAENMQIKALVLSTKLEAVAKSKSAIASKAAAAAQWLLNKAMLASPLVWAAAAIAALVGGLVLLVSWLSRSAKVQREATAAQQEYERAARRTEQALAEGEVEALKRSVETRKRYREELKALIAAGASKEAIARKEQEMQDELTRHTEQDTETRIRTEREALAAAETNAAKQQQAYEALKRIKGEDNKKTQEQLKVAQDAAAEVTRLQNAVLTSIDNASEAAYQLARSSYDRRAESADRYYTKLQKRLDDFHAYEKAQLEVSSVYIYDYSKSVEENAELRFAAEQQYAAKSFELEQRQAREKLKAQRMTAEERRVAEATLRRQQLQDEAVFAAKQLAALEEHNRELLRTAIDAAGGKDVDGQIADTRAKYAAALETIKKDATLAADERAFYERKLAEQEAVEIRRIRREAEETAGKQIAEANEERYRDDVRRFSEAAAEQVALEVDKQKALIAARRAAGLDTMAEERALAKSEEALRAARLESDLRMVWRNAAEQYRIKREYLDQELEAAGLTAERRAELEEELTNLITEETQRRVASIEQWASAAMSMASGVNDFMNSLGEAEVQRYEESTDDKKKALDKQLKAGIISQKDYDKQSAALDEQLDAKKAKIAREQAKREKAMAIFQIGVDTALAIMKTLAAYPFPVNAVMSALTGALAAVQLAAVVAKPLPMARKGGRIVGATHEQGGVLVNTENEERIISAAPARVFPELLNLISYIGKHGGRIPETGFALRAARSEGMAARTSTSGVDADKLAEQIGTRVGERVGAELRDLKVYLSLTELREAEQVYARIEDSAKL